MAIAKIVSGGQTGVDRGALDAALKLAFLYSGIIPSGHKAEAYISRPILELGAN